MTSLKALVFMLALAATFAVPGSAIAAIPLNDNFNTAEELTGRETFAEGTNAEATKELTEPDHADNAGGASVWYRWTAPASGETTISCESDFRTLLAVYTGDQLPPPGLTKMAADNDACAPQREVTFTATANTTYRIAVDGYKDVVGDPATGGFFLSVRLAPPNDDFTAAAPLAGDTGGVTGTTLGASSETGEPTHAGVGSNSAWYTWTAPSSGWATFLTCGSPFDTVLAVYTGSDVAALSTVAGNDDACDVGSRVSFEASLGTVYRIAVAGYGDSTGDFTLGWNRNPPPPSVLQFPRISGVARDGDTLTTSDGVWSGAQPITYTYAWGRCDRFFDSCDYIPGATAQTFTIRSVDVGYRLWVRVTASNAVGSAEAVSNHTALVVARAPSNVLLPDVDGEARLGAILVAGPGSWQGTAPISYTYQWQACDAAVATCTDIDGQTGQVMRVNSVDLGDVIRVVVTASNVAGSAAAASAGTDVFRATPPRRRCVVPNVRGKTLRAARTAITRGRCRVGRIQRTFSNRVRAGRIVGQNPRAGARRAVGARVNLVLSKGKRR
jgi:PASTA domain